MSADQARRAGVWINTNGDQANDLAASDPPAGPLDYMVPRVAAALKAAIKERGLSQAELARRLECSVAEVSDRLSGRRNLTLGTMAEMCDLTGLRMDVRFYAPSAGIQAPATGWEHPDTLRFAHEVDQRYGLGLAWVEAVPRRGTGKSSGHRVVTYETASRNGEPFEADVAAYGLPNKTFQLCNRELKKNAMKSYAESIGWKNGSYSTAIGIRADESRRVNPKTAEEEKLIYPLVSLIPTSKDEVLAFFEDFDWDLRIPEHQGNCIGCFKKSDKKLLTLYRESPANFEFPIKLDRLYRDVGPNNVPGPRRMYRGHRSAPDLVAEFAAASPDYRPPTHDGGCSESCELYETEEVTA